MEQLDQEIDSLQKALKEKLNQIFDVEMFSHSLQVRKSGKDKDIKKIYKENYKKDDFPVDVSTYTKLNIDEFWPQVLTGKWKYTSEGKKDTTVRTGLFAFDLSFQFDTTDTRDSYHVTAIATPDPLLKTILKQEKHDSLVKELNNLLEELFNETYNTPSEAPIEEAIEITLNLLKKQSDEFINSLITKTEALKNELHPKNIKALANQLDEAIKLNKSLGMNASEDRYAYYLDNDQLLFDDREALSLLNSSYAILNRQMESPIYGLVYKVNYFLGPTEIEILSEEILKKSKQATGGIQLLVCQVFEEEGKSIYIGDVNNISSSNGMPGGKGMWGPMGLSMPSATNNTPDYLPALSSNKKETSDGFRNASCVNYDKQIDEGIISFNDKLDLNCEGIKTKYGILEPSDFIEDPYIISEKTAYYLPIGCAAFFNNATKIRFSIEGYAAHIDANQKTYYALQRGGFFTEYYESQDWTRIWEMAIAQGQASKEKKAITASFSASHQKDKFKYKDYEIAPQGARVQIKIYHTKEETCYRSLAEWSYEGCKGITNKEELRKKKIIDGIKPAANFILVGDPKESKMDNCDMALLNFKSKLAENFYKKYRDKAQTNEDLDHVIAIAKLYDEMGKELTDDIYNFEKEVLEENYGEDNLPRWFYDRIQEYDVEDDFELYRQQLEKDFGFYAYIKKELGLTTSQERTTVLLTVLTKEKIRQLPLNLRQKAMYNLCSDRMYGDVNIYGNNEEGVAYKLIKHIKEEQIKPFIQHLETETITVDGETMTLINRLADQFNDSEIFSGDGNLTKFCLQLNTIFHIAHKDQMSSNDYRAQLLVHLYEKGHVFHWKSSKFDNRISSEFKRANIHVEETKYIPKTSVNYWDVISPTYLPYTVEVHPIGDFEPFEWVVIVMEDGYPDLGIEEGGMMFAPAFMVHFLVEKKQTAILQFWTHLVIDVASFAIGAAQIKAGVKGVQLAVAWFDVISSIGEIGIAIFEEQLLKFEGGRKFMRGWRIVSAIGGLAGLSAEGLIKLKNIPDMDVNHMFDFWKVNKNRLIEGLSVDAATKQKFYANFETFMGELGKLHTKALELSENIKQAIARLEGSVKELANYCANQLGITLNYIADEISIHFLGMDEPVMTLQTLNGGVVKIPVRYLVDDVDEILHTANSVRYIDEAGEIAEGDLQIVRKGDEVGVRVVGEVGNVFYKNTDEFAATFDPNKKVSSTIRGQAFNYYKQGEWKKLEKLFRDNNLNGGWPPAYGGYNIIDNVPIKKGMKFDRYQTEGFGIDSKGNPILRGSYTSPIEEFSYSYAKRALEGEENKYDLFYEIEVLKDLPFTTVDADVIPWHGHVGGGKQNYWKTPIDSGTGYPKTWNKLAEEGYIRIIIKKSPSGKYQSEVGKVIEKL